MILAIIFIILLSAISFTFSKDKLWSILLSGSLLGFFIADIFLKKDNYLNFASAFSLTTIFIIIFLTIRFNKIRQLFGDIATISDGNFSFFFWLLIVASVILVLGILISKKIYNKMLLKSGPKGDVGPQGERGEVSEILGFKNNKNELAYRILVNHMNEYISTDIKNIFFLEEIRRICYSDDFNKLYINEVDKVTIDCECDNKVQNYNPKALNSVISILKDSSEYWLDTITEYKNGIKFLKSSFYNFEDIYLKQDSRKGLRNNILERLKEENKWNWGL